MHIPITFVTLALGYAARLVWSTLSLRKLYLPIRKLHTVLNKASYTYGKGLYDANCGHISMPGRHSCSIEWLAAYIHINMCTSYIQGIYPCTGLHKYCVYSCRASMQPFITISSCTLQLCLQGAEICRQLKFYGLMGPGAWGLWLKAIKLSSVIQWCFKLLYINWILPMSSTQPLICLLPHPLSCHIWHLLRGEREWVPGLDSSAPPHLLSPQPAQSESSAWFAHY